MRHYCLFNSSGLLIGYVIFLNFVYTATLCVERFATFLCLKRNWVLIAKMHINVTEDREIAAKSPFPIFSSDI